MRELPQEKNHSAAPNVITNVLHQLTWKHTKGRFNRQASENFPVKAPFFKKLKLNQFKILNKLIKQKIILKD